MSEYTDLKVEIHSSPEQLDGWLSGLPGTTAAYRMTETEVE